MNLYVHFPFCRGKCAYCALHSRPCRDPSRLEAHCASVAADILALPCGGEEGERHTVYFGGGSPAMCDLRPVFAAVRERLGEPEEFTVELHPLDATPEVLAMLREGGVNRISMGVQSFDDAALSAMHRLHDAAGAERAFRAVRAAGFENAGIDLIAGWPGTDGESWRRTLERAVALEPFHVSVYSLAREPGTALDARVRRGLETLPSDDEALQQVSIAREALAAAGLSRYEISNYARLGRECRHNLAVWRGEDYVGIGEGAHGRRGRVRSEGGRMTAELSEEEDALERAMFSLRTREGLDLERTAEQWPVLVPRLPAWRKTLDFNADEGLLERQGKRYLLTARGAEVCDSILAELV